MSTTKSAGVRRPAPPVKISETTTRVLVALVGIPVGMGVIYVGGWALAVLLAAIAAASAAEFYRLAEQKGIRSHVLLGCGLAAAFVLLAGIDPAGGPREADFTAALVVVILITATVGIWTRGVSGQPLLALSTTITGAVYAGVLLSFGLFLRHLPGNVGAWHGSALLFAPVLLTWASDTFAYFAGRTWGTRKLIPKVSPGKTVQGAVGAVAGTVVVAVAYSFVLARFPTYRPGIGMAVLFGLVISLAAQIGDLAESLIKRDAGVKDSGRLLPGHGGALDRFDSLFFTLPIGYFFFRFVLDAPSPF